MPQREVCVSCTFTPIKIPRVFKEGYMDPEEVRRQVPMASLNIGINKFTEHNAVEHSFLVRHWHQIECVRWMTGLRLEEGGSVEAVAREVVNEAVRGEILHHSLAEHAVLYARWQLAGTS
jgi:hypothetical protein